MLPVIPVKEVLRANKWTTGKTIYGYNPELNTFNTWNSLEECTFFFNW